MAKSKKESIPIQRIHVFELEVTKTDGGFISPWAFCQSPECDHLFRDCEFCRMRCARSGILAQPRRLEALKHVN